MTKTKMPTTIRGAKAMGWKFVGEFGFGSAESGAIFARPEDHAAAKHVYMTTEADCDRGVYGLLAEIESAGGVYIRDDAE